jgi:hypothetical protein
LLAWVQAQNLAGHRFMLVVGGALNEAASAAIARSATLNDPNVVNVGVGSVQDDGLLDNNGNPAVLSSSQLAPRIAGILAQKGETGSATFARLGGLTILQGPTQANITDAFDGGVVVLGRDSNVDSPVRIEKALTSYTLKTDPARPYLIFRNPKFVRTMQLFETEIEEFAADVVIGQLPVNDKTRQLLVGEMHARLDARVEQGIIQPNPTVVVSTNPPPNDDDEFIALDYGSPSGAPSSRS